MASIKPGGSLVLLTFSKLSKQSFKKDPQENIKEEKVFLLCSESS